MLANFRLYVVKTTKGIIHDRNIFEHLLQHEQFKIFVICAPSIQVVSRKTALRESTEVGR